MFAVFALAAALEGSPAPACAAADPAVTDIRVKLIKKRKAPDHYIITATVTNVGEKPQELGVKQRVELVENGSAVAPQPLPALGAGVDYDVAFAIFRAAEKRKEALPVTVRYVFEKGDATRNNCSTANDALTKSF
ncbi:MAG: hypothetical protein NVS3B7_20490 [Candidatus Elarobacter sp.]